MEAFALFRDHCKSIASLFPDLRIEENEAGVPQLRGTMTLFQDGELVDSYEILIKPTAFYPHRFPLVYETAGRLPKNIDWHIYESDGHFCLCTIPDELVKCKVPVALSSFLDMEVRPYLFNQTHRRLRGFYIKERPHGFDKDFEFYSKALNTIDPVQIARFFRFLLSREQLPRTAMCCCGSGKKYRKCHKEAFKMFSILENDEIKFILRSVISSREFVEAFQNRELP